MKRVNNILETKGWKGGTEVFWGEIAPCDHTLQIYEDNEQFIDTLEAFVTDGFHLGESVIIIATTNHRTDDHDLFNLTLHDQYIPLSAEDTLAQFMINGWPEENLFCHLLTNLLLRARKKDRRVRAFGEIVAVLWSQGFSGATVHLEHFGTSTASLNGSVFSALIQKAVLRKMRTSR